MSDDTRPDTIVLVHGFWVTPRSWEGWVDHYEKKGYTVLAPAYPGFEVEVEALNADPTRSRPSLCRRSSSTLRVDRPGSTGRRSSWATPPGRVRPRSSSTTASAPSAWRSTRHRPKASKVAALARLQATFPVLKNPANHHKCRRVRPEAVALRLHQHLHRRARRRGCTSATTSPRPARSSGAASSPTCTPATRTSRSTTRTTARAPLLFISGSEDHIMPPKVQRRTPSTTSPNTVTEVEGLRRLQPPAPRPRGLGGGRRLRPRLGRTERGVPV